MAAARLIVKPGMSQPHSSVRLLEDGGGLRRAGGSRGVVPVWTV